MQQFNIEGASVRTKRGVAACGIDQESKRQRSLKEIGSVLERECYTKAKSQIRCCIFC